MIDKRFDNVMFDEIQFLAVQGLERPIELLERLHWGEAEIIERVVDFLRNTKVQRATASDEPVNGGDTDQSVLNARKLARDNHKAVVLRLAGLGAPLASTLAETIDLFAGELYNEWNLGGEVVKEIDEIRTDNGRSLDGWANGEAPWLP
jgi:hypothetical protein